MLKMQDQTVTDFDNNQILHPGSRHLFRSWEMLRAERPCPAREDFDMASLKSVLADMVVIDRDYLRNSFKYRLAGSHVCDLFKQNLTGGNVLAGWDSFESDVLSRHLMTVVNQMQPAVIRMRLVTDRGQAVAAEMLLLPVRMRDSQRVQVLGGLFAFRAARSLGHSGIASRELAAARVIWTEHEAIAPAEASTQPANLRAAARQFTLISGGRA
jgi:hypothetical protein